MGIIQPSLEKRTASREFARFLLLSFFFNVTSWTTSSAFSYTTTLMPSIMVGSKVGEQVQYFKEPLPKRAEMIGIARRVVIGRTARSNGSGGNYPA